MRTVLLKRNINQYNFILAAEHKVTTVHSFFEEQYSSCMRWSWWPGVATCYISSSCSFLSSREARFQRTFQAVDACMYSQAENVDSDEGMLHLIWHLVRFSLHTRSTQVS